MVNNTLLVGLVLAAGAALLRRRRRPAARAPPPPPSPWLTAADAEKPHGRSKGARSHAGEQKRRPSAAGAPGGKPRDEGDGADSDANGMLWATLDLLVTLVTAACTLAAVALLVLRGTPDLGVLVAAAWAAQAARAQAKASGGAAAGRWHGCLRPRGGLVSRPLAAAVRCAPCCRSDGVLCAGASRALQA